MTAAVPLRRGVGPERFDDDVPLAEPPCYVEVSEPASFGAGLPARREVNAEPDDSMGANPEPPREYKLTELGNAERLAHEHGNHLRYVKGWRAWLNYDGRRWCRDEVGAEVVAAKSIVRVLYAEAGAIARLAAGGDERAGDKAEALMSWANKSSSEHGIRAMTTLAQTEPPIAATADRFDQHPMLLNVENGTLDLQTGTLRQHRREDMITQLAPVRFSPAALAPRWSAFLERVQPDAAVRQWLQKFFGYCLTGDVGAQILVFFLGVGANGKSTLLGVIQALLGDYSAQGSPGLLLASDRGGDDQGKRHRAMLRGKRLVPVQEIEAGRYLNEAQVKAITGSDKITGARLYENETEFDPTHKLVIGANHRPHVRGQDHGIWRRIRLVPFTVTIPAEERDPDLTTKLMAESSGILNWLIEGCLAWQREGLEPPASITVATDDYKASEDRLGDFLEAHTVRDPAGAIATSELHRLFVTWCEARSERPWRQQALSSAIEERGLELGRAYIAGVQTRAVLGLRRKGDA